MHSAARTPLTWNRTGKTNDRGVVRDDLAPEPKTNRNRHGNGRERPESDSPEEKSARTGSPGPDENRRRGRTLAAREPGEERQNAESDGQTGDNAQNSGQDHPFTIESGKEEAYRLAEREVNNYLALIKQQKIRNWSEQDYLAMAALKFAIANVKTRLDREPDADDLGRLERLDDELDAYLNSRGVTFFTIRKNLPA